MKIQYKWLVAIAFVAGFFMDLMDITIVNVALPTLAKELNASQTTLEWVVTGYLLSLAIWIPASGWIGDKFGTKKTFLFALAVFTLGSALSSMAGNIQMLVASRVIQGVGGGMMTPVGVAMLFRAFPPEERAAASSILSIPAAAAPAIGPVLGGFLVDFTTWRWIFLVNVPIGIFAFLFAWKVLKEHKEENAGKFDITGFLLAGVGLAFLLYALSSVPVYGPGSVRIIVTGILGAGLLTAALLVESRIKDPILHFSLYKERLFRTTNLVMFFAFALWIGFLFVLPLFLQLQLGHTAFESGLTSGPQALGWIAMAAVASRLYKKIGPRRMVMFGLLGTTIMTFGFIFMNTGVDLWTVRGALFLRGASMAFAVIPIQAAAFANISGAETGRASSIFNTNRQVASSFGTALLGTVLFEMLKGTTSTAGQLLAYHVSFIVAAAMGVIAIIFASTIHDEDAAESMKASTPGPPAH
ncbi:drug resistance transporter, EmrB/QacA subfamily [Dehalogenimonas formicexedens]|uniref:Drug resistance transporter, EmrB/QacA subfamily n=1 Tax=Dehalogenimonas formicexedens TaxID=1839801 RepID=A0A1P8FAG2_9CHLR|nr:DHA2 family efflux MFS transporter permease subunit [Dehalogenimonas formicexedens]APV45456.1 drug resistance transporter, EmrB/QacA subfamily [Dehalogenimonas formicexedens]